MNSDPRLDRKNATEQPKAGEGDNSGGVNHTELEGSRGGRRKGTSRAKKGDYQGKKASMKVQTLMEKA